MSTKPPVPRRHGTAGKLSTRAQHPLYQESMEQLGMVYISTTSHVSGRYGKTKEWSTG